MKKSKKSSKLTKGINSNRNSKLSGNPKKKSVNNNDNPLDELFESAMLNNIETLSSQISGELIVDKIIKHKLRLRIFLLLYIYPELNVSEISKKLNTSKATVSRHLKAMEQDGILTSRVIFSQGRINPVLYSLQSSILSQIKESSSKRKKLQFRDYLDPEKRLNLYRRGIKSFKSLSKLMIYGIDLITPILDFFDSKLLDIDSADEYFARVFDISKQKFRINPVVVSEEQFPDALRLYEEFYSNLKKLSEKSEKNNETRAILVLNSIIPLKELLEFKVDE